MSSAQPRNSRRADLSCDGQDAPGAGNKVERVTITIDAELRAFVDALSTAQGYGSRSEAIRDILRKAAGKA